jgi:hypothetical protein
LTPVYGRAPRGERAIGSTPINYGQNVTLIGALGSDGLDALLMIEGATDGEVFRAYTERILCPIEACWSKLKQALRAAGARTRRKLERAIKRALETITEADALAWFAHCGYKLN